MRDKLILLLAIIAPIALIIIAKITLVKEGDLAAIESISNIALVLAVVYLTAASLFVVCYSAKSGK